MDVDKLKAILTALQGTDVTRLTWVSGQETLDVRLAIRRRRRRSPRHGGPWPSRRRIRRPRRRRLPPAAAAAAAPCAEPARDKKTFTRQLAVRRHLLPLASPDSPPFVDVGRW